MSQHLDSLAIGDTIEFSGPTGHIRYEDNGVFVIEKKKGELGLPITAAVHLFSYRQCTRYVTAF